MGGLLKVISAFILFLFFYSCSSPNNPNSQRPVFTEIPIVTGIFWMDETGNELGII